MLPSWLVIGGVTFLIALGSSFLRPKDVKWFNRLQRPRWLTFEKAIPLIWTIVFICGAWSAYIVWEMTQSWQTMALYILVEAVIVAYSPVLLWTHSLRNGTIIGGLGFLLGLLLAVLVFPVSTTAGLLLLPYLIWSPIGTYTTWEMGKLNPESF
ncbi:TspO/MBR family protein [Leptolyngbya boryana NIES-2135]|jgi:benzodiazapine receptor|uniref:TspO/MBR family protein n=1 Tax=Leptolyngbya boryana NIES-2135 TaxID=1973484 RepID=A0A1Z4JG41_LEPBY|nr:MULTISPECIES: tryptophan-rich sensory protein [Leptolyngbya]BAY55638.1 TspO/MBR family protein [Leptolyngbya boryana NIES-2135]MBD2369996.1 tryptophan-rich sensory protein [Leptolyngbya sp. FACHB-161]MBD2376302.1 tryptophan-rich sensory protein [Leptolyngbya sp. FACHB-238]MBD2400577.1 tryptophan-rich sensory protein [Leptolyngbya sp. FACHB-239]MBD2407119.1 tryptophan-rich sensory protein [Leptolyngbya sp. FACHB-402]